MYSGYMSVQRYYLKIFSPVFLLKKVGQRCVVHHYESRSHMINFCQILFYKIIFLKINFQLSLAWFLKSRDCVCLIHEMFIQVCVNDDLVAKNFACYVSPMEDKNFDSLEKPRLNVKSASFSNKLNPALTLWPMFLQGKDSQRMESEWISPMYVSLKLSYL